MLDHRDWLLPFLAALRQGPPGADIPPIPQPGCRLGAQALADL